MIPRKITNNFKIISKKKDKGNTYIEGMLTCCNSFEFEVNVVGKIKYGLFNRIYVTPDNEKIAISVRCKKCGMVISAFDSCCDGYEQCDKKIHMLAIKEALVCKKCSNNNFSVGIKYEYPDIQELEDIGIIEIDNAFTWIWVTLECNICGTRNRNFIDFETS